MEVIEQPFCCGGDKLPGPDIVRQGPVRLAQHAGVVIEPKKDVTGTAPRARVDRKACGERKRTLFQSLDAEQLVAKRFLRRLRLGAPQLPEECAHRIRRRYVTAATIMMAGTAMGVMATETVCDMPPPRNG